MEVKSHTKETTGENMDVNCVQQQNEVNVGYTSFLCQNTQAPGLHIEQDYDSKYAHD